MRKNPKGEKESAKEKERRKERREAEKKADNNWSCVRVSVYGCVPVLRAQPVLCRLQTAAVERCHQCLQNEVHTS